MIGVLSLQGGVIEHLGHLAQLEVECRTVRSPNDLLGLKGLIIPGGESTCLRRLLKQNGLVPAIRAAWQAGLWVWGTCAGCILAAASVEGEEACLCLIDAHVRRNAFGSQLDSFTATANVPAVSSSAIPLVFIRAPHILSVGPGVRVLLRTEHGIAAAQGTRVLVTTFHPELTPNLAFHAYFAEQCGAGQVMPPADKPREETGSGLTWPRTAGGLKGRKHHVGGAVARSQATDLYPRRAPEGRPPSATSSP